MKKDIKDTSEYEEGPFYKPIDFINKDLDLLFLIIFIEAFKEKREEINFGEFFKGDYWDIDQVMDEIMDTNDYYSIPDMVIEQAIFMFEDLRMGKVLEVGIDNTEDAIKDILVKVANTGSENIKKEVEAYYYSIEQLFFLSNQKSEHLRAYFEKNPEKFTRDSSKDKSVFFKREERYLPPLQTTIIETPTHILIRVKYNEKRIKEIEKEIEDYLNSFSKDEKIENLPPYQEKRLYFSQQIENFYKYINRLNLIGDVINIPFTILSETGFEAVKILRLLQLKGVIKMRWSDEGSWKAQFTKLPITPESLLGISSKADVSSDGLKSGLSFNNTTSILTVGEYDVKINGPDQKEFLKIIFKYPERLDEEWFFSEIAEIYDFANDINDKKFYNASYQVNLKVAQKTPIKDLLLTTKQSVKINPKYL